jgi:hypothetical protein
MRFMLLKNYGSVDQAWAQCSNGPNPRQRRAWQLTKPNAATSTERPSPDRDGGEPVRSGLIDLALPAHADTGGRPHVTRLACDWGSRPGRSDLVDVRNVQARPRTAGLRLPL